MTMASIESLPTELVYRIANFTVNYPLHYDGGKRRARFPGVLYYGCYQNAWARTCRHFYAILNPIQYQRNLTKDHPLDSCVFWAARYGRLRTIEIAVANGANLNATGAPNSKLWQDDSVQYGTALHFAIRYEHMNIVEYLLATGVNVHLPSMGLCRCCPPRQYSAYPLHIALNHPKVQDRERLKPFVARLARNGAYLMAEGAIAAYRLAELSYYDILEPMLPQAEPKQVTDILHLAVRQGNIENVSRILQYPHASVVSRTNFGSTVLRQAVESQKPKILELLLQRPDADPTTKDGLRNTLLHTAVSCYSGVDCSKILLKQPGIKVNEGNIYGDTPLYCAALRGIKDIIVLLLGHPDIDVNTAGEGGRPALHAAASKGVGEVLELLLNRPEIDVNRAGKDGHTPLHMAASTCDKEVLDLLLAHPNIDVHTYTEDGCTLLHMVPKAENTPPETMIEIIDRLLDYGLPINHVSPTVATALSVAICAQQYAVALHLLCKGADPLIEAHCNGTRNLLLNFSMKRNGGKLQEQLVRELLSRGVPFDETTIDPNDPEPCNDGGTALFYAAAYAQSPILVRLLLKAGADPSSKVLKSTTEMTEYGEPGEQQLLLPAVFRYFWDKNDVSDDDVTGGKRAIIKLLVRAGSCIGKGGAGYSALEFAMLNDTIELGSHQLVKLLLDNANAAQVEYEHVRELIYEYAMYRRRTRKAIMAFAAKWFPERFMEDKIPERAPYEPWGDEMNEDEDSEGDDKDDEDDDDNDKVDEDDEESDDNKNEDDQEERSW